MIKQETYGNGLIRTYSDENRYLIQREKDIWGNDKETGRVYREAIDLPNRYTYTEGEIIEEENIDDYERI